MRLRLAPSLLPALAALALVLAGVTVLVACTSSGDPAAPPFTEPLPVTAATDAGIDAGTSPTWYRDVEPIVQVACAGCHVVGGTGGFAVDRATAVEIAGYIGARLTDRYMPPWPPTGDGAPLVGSRALTPAAVAVWNDWAAAGAPLGDPQDHVDRLPRAAILPARSADLRLTMPDVYQGPTSVFVADEVRCFVLDLPGTPELADGAWITASSWHAGTPIGIHSIAGVPLDADAARTARARQGQDGRAGFECGGGYGDLVHGPPIGANGTGAAQDGSTLPAGTAVVVPNGGALLMRVHYAVKHLGGASDTSAVDLWLASDAERQGLHALELLSVTAPTEVPCATGLTDDPADACSRANAFARLAVPPATATTVQARADARLAACGTTLDATRIGLTFSDATAAHFLVPSSCAVTAAFDGIIRVVHARMLTHGASVKVEAESATGWTTVLDIPAWRWAWDGAYVLEQGVPLPAGRRVRVSCMFDNGMASQWSSLTGQPGHDSLSRPPQLPAQYLVDADNHAGEQCAAYLGIEPTTL